MPVGHHLVRSIPLRALSRENGERIDQEPPAPSDEFLAYALQPCPRAELAEQLRRHPQIAPVIIIQDAEIGEPLAPAWQAVHQREVRTVIPGVRVVDEADTLRLQLSNELV